MVWKVVVVVARCDEAWELAHDVQLQPTVQINPEHHASVTTLQKFSCTTDGLEVHFRDITGKKQVKLLQK
jgi:hypothetical protein